MIYNKVVSHKSPIFLMWVNAVTEFIDKGERLKQFAYHPMLRSMEA